MGLTLGNDLTKSVSLQINASTTVAKDLGDSMTSGRDKLVAVVDGFIGNSLNDSGVILGAVAKNTAYSINMLTITDEYLKTVATSLQEGLKVIGSAGPLSADKLAVLQKNLDDKEAQVNLLITTADFDGKSLLAGDASKVDVQVGLTVTDKLTLTVTDFAGGKLLRSSVTAALNTWMKTPANSTYYASAAEVKIDTDKNINLSKVALANAGGAGSGGAMTVGELANGLESVRDADAKIKSLLDQALPVANAFLTNANAGVTMSNASNVQLAAMLADAGSLAEINLLLNDNAITDISKTGTAAATAARVLAQDVFTNALNSIRNEQAAIANQKSNVHEAADALRTTTNVTQKAADSYLKTDYVLTAQQYSETIRNMSAAISALQAANKVPEAALRLVESLAR
jgi:flagellin-like hook-associated protein FlgL